MIRKLVRRMLTAQILSALTVSLCLLIDSIMIGRYLGVGAIAAYGLANPILLIIGAVGSMLSSGVQVVCSKSLGRGLQQEANAGYSSAVAMAAAVSLAGVLLVALFRAPLARLMGAGADAELFHDTKDYMLGFILGAPASMGALILVPFLQMAGRSGLLIAAVLGMTVSDVAFDLLNALVFHGGMFGMGLASSLSYYVALIIGGGYFLSKKSVFRFSRGQVRLQKMGELLAGGVPTVFNMASTVVLIFVMNKLLMFAGGQAAVAAFSVVNTIGNASNCISTGLGGVALTLSGVLSNEEDRTGLRQMLGLLARRAVALGLIVGALLAVFAPACVGLFIPEAGESRALAVWGLRAFAVGLIPCGVNNVLRYSYLGVGRVVTTEVISIVENALLPSLAAVGLWRLRGMGALWFYFAAGEALTLLGIAVWVWIRRRRVTLRPDDVLLLPEGFGAPSEDMMETDVRGMGDIVAAASAAEAFCRAHGHDDAMARRIALCVEELGGNIVRHGFDSSGRNHLFIRLMVKDGAWTLRFRDDCQAFDPL